MTTKSHSTLTGSDLHEPKGVASATAGQVYISNGAGSGAWTDTGSTIGTTNFTTGDVKITLKTTADSGWVMFDDGTIGDLSSGATSLASASTQALFTLLWTNVSNTNCPVSGGRGASAAADYAAHKTIALPKVLGRALASAGNGSGLSSRTLAAIAGLEAVTLSATHLPVITPTGSVAITDPGHSHGFTANSRNLQSGTGASIVEVAAGFVATTTVSPTGIGATFTGNSFGGGTEHVNLQPTVFLNVMVKL